MQICKLEREYWDARNKYEKMCEKVAVETESIEDSLYDRDTLYARMTKDEVNPPLLFFKLGVWVFGCTIWFFETLTLTATFPAKLYPMPRLCCRGSRT